jgi:hypothetical protein
LIPPRAAVVVKARGARSGCRDADTVPRRQIRTGLFTKPGDGPHTTSWEEVVVSLGHCMELASHIRQHMDCETGSAGKAMLLGEMLGVACAAHRAQFDGHTLRAETQARLDAYLESHNRMDAHLAYLEGRGLLPYARAAGAEGAPLHQGLFKPACAGGPAHVAGLCPAQHDHTNGRAARSTAAAAPDAIAYVPHHCGVFGAWPGWAPAYFAAPGATPCAPAGEARVPVSVPAGAHPGAPVCGGRHPLLPHTPPLLYSADGGGLACWFPAADPDAQRAQAYRQAVGGDAALWLDAAGWDPVCPGRGAGQAFGAIGEARACRGDLDWAQAILPHAAPAVPAPEAAADSAAGWTADERGRAPTVSAAAAASEAGRKAPAPQLVDWTARRRRREHDDGADCQRRLKAARG